MFFLYFTTDLQSTPNRRFSKTNRTRGFSQKRTELENQFRTSLIIISSSSVVVVELRGVYLLSSAHVAVCCVAVVKAPTLSDSLSAFVSYSGYDQLKTEVECCHATLAQLDSAVDSAVKQLVQQTSQVCVSSVKPVSTTRVDGPSTRLVETRARQHGPCWRVMETGHPSTQAINSGSQLG